MKILIDARFYGIENGGLGRYTINLLKELSMLSNAHTYYVLLREPHFSTLALPTNFKKVRSFALHYGFIEQIEIPLLYLKIRPHLTHFLHLNVPLLYPGKFYVTIHDLIMHHVSGSDSTTRSSLFYQVKRIAYHLVFQMAVRRAVVVITPTQAVKNELLAFYKFLHATKVSVTYEGVDTSLHSSPEKIIKKSEPPFFLFVGNAYPHKNLGVAIDAIKHINTIGNKRAQLRIVTPRNIFFNRLNELIESKNAQKYVVIIPRVSDSELQSLYVNTQAFIFPSLIEGFGLPGLEALSFSTPLIASDIPVFHEVYGDAAAYFPANDHISLANQMENVLQSSEKEKERRERISLKQVALFSWKEMAQQTLKLYNAAK